MMSAVFLIISPSQEVNWEEYRVVHVVLKDNRMCIKNSSHILGFPWKGERERQWPKDTGNVPQWSQEI